ncbi:MAG: non-canonical purine NTP pyrophosphatase [Candidatus Woesearchaeota archaeon]
MEKKGMKKDGTEKPKRIYFATGNKHKFAEVKEIFDSFGIELVQSDVKPEEDKSKSIQEIAKHSAKQAAEELNAPAIADDTGIYFIAMGDWPGNSPKDVFEKVGYEGLLKALEGKTREAYFETAAAYCAPGEDPVVFTGRMPGRITKEVFGINRDVMPYERIFVPEGQEQAIVFIPEVKKKISHRVKAFRKVAEHIAKA